MDRFKTALEHIGNGYSDIRTEDELEKLFHESGFYKVLGYTRVGRDIRGKANTRGGIPDVLLLNEDESER